MGRDPKNSRCLHNIIHGQSMLPVRVWCASILSAQASRRRWQQTVLRFEKQRLAVVCTFSDKIADQVVVDVVSAAHAVVLRKKKTNRQ